MNELTNLEKIRFLKKYLTKDHLETYKNAFQDSKGNVSFHYNVFVPFCHAYSEFLLVSGSLDEYGYFINEFNELIETDATYLLIKDVQEKGIVLSKQIPVISANYSKTFIKDKRPLVKNGQFLRELDLEEIIVSELNDFLLGEGFEVKTQQNHGYGRSDITINDTTIELKKGLAKRMDVYQTFEYSFDNNINHVCLLAKRFDEKTIQIANKLNVACYQYSFIYEERMDSYPKGFVIERVNHTLTNIFDECLAAMDETFWISFYDPTFNIDQVYSKKNKLVNEIFSLTNKYHENLVEIILNKLEKEGVDTSKGIDHFIEQLSTAK